MIRRTTKCGHQKSNIPDNIDPKIIEESQRWVRDNEGVISESMGYNSPRISSELPDCSMPMTFDHFNYCSLGCLYCFAYFFKSNNPAIKSVSLKSVNPKAQLAAMRGESTNKQGRLFYEHFYSKKFLFHWGGLADPFCSFEKHNKVGLKLIKGLARMKYPTLFSFKGDGIFKRQYTKIFEHYSHQKNFAFQISIVTNSDKLASEVEIGVPSTTKRLEAIKMLSDMGYWTILRLRPFIIGVSDQGLDELLERALAAGINGISMEFFAQDGRANTGMKTRYAAMAKLMGISGDLHQYFKATSPSERGGYMRTNRLVKERHVRKVYEFCAKHGLTCGISDPDYKELNTSGSCCAMPDIYNDNPDLQNWTRSQLTYHLKEARVNYHKTGECRELLFNDVYGDESYLDDPALANDHVSVIGKCCADRNALTQRIILQMQWNNLRSPANPRNYFNGKMLPIGLDSDGNLKYKYNPSPYEARWIADGVDLTK